MEGLLLLPISILVGFLGGGFLLTQLMRWGLLLQVVTAKHGGDFLGPPRRRLLWAFPFALILHPAPYIVIALLFAVYSMLRSPQLLFWGAMAGLVAYLAVVGLSLLRAFRIRRRKRLVGSRP